MASFWQLGVVPWGSQAGGVFKMNPASLFCLYQVCRHSMGLCALGKSSSIINLNQDAGNRSSAYQGYVRQSPYIPETDIMYEFKDIFEKIDKC